MWERGKTLPHFTVGDYVLVARVSRQGQHRKLMSTWTGRWRVANDDKAHVYAVQHLITAELRGVHVAKMRFGDKEHVYAVQHLVTAEPHEDTP